MYQLQNISAIKRIPTTIRNNTFSKTSILLATLWIFGAGKMTVNMLLTA